MFFGFEHLYVHSVEENHGFSGPLLRSAGGHITGLNQLPGILDNDLSSSSHKMADESRG